MDPSSKHSAGSRGLVPGSSSAPAGTKQRTKGKIRGRLADVRAVLSKGAGVFDFGPWKSALDDIDELTNAIRKVTSSREHGEALVEELEEVLNDVCEHLSRTTSPAVKSSVEDFAKGVRMEIELWQDNRRQSARTGRLEEAMRTDEEVEECCRRVKMLLHRLNVGDCFASGETLLIGTKVKANVSAWKTVDEEATKRLLKTLPDSPSAKYCSTEAESLGRGECTPNTRVELLEQLREWACDDQAQKVYWLNGMAGTGKTTIAYSLCEYLQSVQKLGASFFCSQRLPECRDVNRIVPSISYRLSQFSVPFRHTLASVLQDDEDAHNQPLPKQFDALLAKTLRTTTDTFPANVVIVIDALDECDDQAGVAKVLTTLLSHAAGLPVKFFVTSRPEPKIVDQMRKKDAQGVRLELRLHELESTVVRQDIATYLTTELVSAEISDAEMAILVRRSGVLFIYAATVVRFIEFDDFIRSEQRLKLVLDASATSTNEIDEPLDELYTTILKTALEPKGLTRTEKEAQETLLRHVVCAREPLSLDAMAGLLQVDNTLQVSAALRPLQSVLSVSESGVIGTLHESFPNYLLNHARSGRFYCDPGRHHARMAQQCFSLIKVPSPPFNICNLESSYLLDDEVPDIGQRVDQAISQALLYACRYWAAHLERADYSQDCCQPLYEFLSERLLLWMEVMGLKKQMWEGVDILRKAQTWCKVHAGSDDLRLLAQDASGFASAVVSGLALRSTPHIYISALPFWPKSRPVTRHYSSRFSGLVNVAGTAISSRNELTPATVDLSVDHISHFAYSPNSKLIAFFGHSNDVTIWNVRTGRRKASIGGTRTRLSSVAFSHDGLHLVLGYVDGTVCIWDTQTHEMVGDPLRCHSTGRIESVACSPAGDHIAAGSSDNNIYIWHRCTGQIVASLPGYTYWAQLAAYSPDGAYIAFGSLDGAVRIWSVYSSQVRLVHELSSYARKVSSVAFCPDGAYVASGTCDQTICIWNARTGVLVGEPLRGHGGWVTSLQYSPSGSHLASVSTRDGSVCIWDPLAGQLVTRLLPARGDLSISWVSYSLDGEQLLACSDRGTLYIWDWSAVEAGVQTCFDNPVDVENALHRGLDDTPDNLCVANRVEGVGQTHAPQTADKSAECHHKKVTALAYSPDGAYIVSGSDDCTLRIWDVRTGRMVGQPLEGHTNSILSVSFSPDGTRVVSGSLDRTIRIWDVDTCTMLGAPLIGHTGGITSVSYSPDSAHIASGSNDKTIRIWDAYTGQMVGSPLIDHVMWVKSVSYSPDGAFLVSGSYGAVRIWNTQTGGIVGCPLEGRASSVKSVAYSPDGMYIVSCSEDTVCVCDAYTGSMIGQHHKFDRNQFYSISYSSVGASLSFSHLNGAIHVSHSHADRDLVMPFRLHHADDGYLRPTCVFSPDGTRVASGHDDGTIRLSSVHIRQVLDAEMESHGDRPCAVAPCPCSACASHSDWGTWKLDKDGWAVTANSQKLIWVPVDLRKSLQLPHTIVVISRSATWQLDFSSAKVGANWFECYTP
ncbi:hypothetical protein FRC09_000319 [Ceratobasidium sp. 395]|nr:hypothetical protein FRC09_000319 [Ceratobasidium sp. 395]